MNTGFGLRRILCSFALALSLACSPLGARAEEGAPAPALSGQTNATGPAEATPALPEGVRELKYEGGLLWLQAKDADLRALFVRMAKVTGAEISVDEAITARVSVVFEGLGLEDAVRKVLQAAGEENFAVEYGAGPGGEPGRLRAQKVHILRKGVAGGLPSEAEEAPSNEDEEIKVQMRRIAERDRMYREFFDEMDRKENRLALSLKEYADPNTPRDRKIKLKTYLSQTPIRTPEEKNLLRAALFDPRFERIVDAVELALLHAMQDMPEEEDKDLLLEVFQSDLPPGWLLYAAKTMWDDRFGPALVQKVKENPERTTTIEVLGDMRVKEAVPVLERALSYKKQGVRRDACYALMRITGKKYDWEEIKRRPAIEWSGE